VHQHTQWLVCELIGHGITQGLPVRQEDTP